ncbi:MAG: TonB-dependent receptor [Bacteroidetes bacterium]|nr:TonB-dependent receptor [Bacteroidota bacterium]
MQIALRSKQLLHLTSDIRYLISDIRYRISDVRCRIVVLLLLAEFSLNAQILDKPISINIKNKPLQEALKTITEEGKVNFSYNPQNIPSDKTVSINCYNKPLKEVLDDILKPYGITFFELENQIVLKLPAALLNPQHVEQARPPRHFTISGFIREKNSGEVLIGADVFARGTTYGTNSNSYGFYSLTLPEGKYVLDYSFLGFREIMEETDVTSDQRISKELEEIRLDIKEVEVKPKEAGSDIRRSQLSDFNFSSRTLASLPGFAGAPDILKALQAVPGIRSFGDGSSLYYVRGGNSDQNLLLLDETPIYNPSHLFGFFSALSPDAVNDIQVYKGDFPPRFGGRLSSVVDVTAREGNMKRFGFSGNLGPYASNISVEGPIWKNHASFFVSGRLSTLNWLNYLLKDQPSFNIQFYDINAKLNLIANENNRFYLTFYTGRDDFSRLNESAYRTFGISWNNILGTARWNYVFNKKLFSNTTLNYSRYNYYLYTTESQNSFWTSSISNLTFKSDFTWFLNSGNTLRSGLEVTNYNSNPGNLNHSSGSDKTSAGISVPRYNSMEYVLYLGNEQRLGNHIVFKYGIRLPLWQDLGSTTVYSFDANYQLIDSAKYKNYISYFTYFSPEPRISIIYNITERTSLKFGYSRNTQFIQQLSNSTGPFTSLDVWVPCGPNIPAQKADQWALGGYHKFSHDRLLFSAEVFYKAYIDHLDYKDHANLLYNPLIEGELRFGKAWAYGIELMLRKAEGRLTGWISYTWSRSLVQTPSVNNGETYPSNFDSPNDVCINISYDNHRHWAFSAVWYYHTGSPVTTPTGFYYNNGYSVPVYGARNNSRLPDYHRLDLSVTYRISKPEKRFQQNVILTLYNAYGRYNPYSMSFNRIMDSNGNLVVPSNLQGGYQLIPTTISVAGIIPSINYQFKF